MHFISRFCNVFALTALTGLVCASAVHAQTTVYNQSTNLAGSDASQNDTAPFGFGNYATSYDDFSLASATPITGVTWVGDYFSGNPATITAFTVNFYGDAAGIPGSLLQTSSISGNANETPLGLDTFGNSAFSYAATLPTPFAAAAGTRYWMSVVPDLAYPPSWGWEIGTGGDGAAQQRYNGTMSSLSNDLAFSLVSTATPEPGSYALLAGMGLTGAVCLRRRKRAHKAV